MRREQLVDELEFAFAEVVGLARNPLGNMVSAHGFRAMSGVGRRLSAQLARPSPHPLVPVAHHFPACRKVEEEIRPHPPLDGYHA